MSQNFELRVRRGFSSGTPLVVLSTQYGKKILLFSCLEQLANRPAEHGIADVSLMARRLIIADAKCCWRRRHCGFLYYLSGSASADLQGRIRTHNTEFIMYIHKSANQSLSIKYTISKQKQQNAKNTIISSNSCSTLGVLEPQEYPRHDSLKDRQ
jgi:hypothetical protein